MPATIETDAAIREAILADPDLNDRQIAALVERRLRTRIGGHTRVRQIRAELHAAPDEPPPPPTPGPLVLCRNCDREGTPSPRDPTLCKACGISPETAAHRARQFPPRSTGAQVALDILGRTTDPYIAHAARRAYVRERAADFGILQTQLEAA